MPPTPNGELWRELRRLEADLERHEKDLYRGNGLPGLTTRMAKVEEAIKTVAENVNAIKYYFRAIAVMVGGLILHALWDLISKK